MTKEEQIERVVRMYGRYEMDMKTGDPATQKDLDSIKCALLMLRLRYYPWSTPTYTWLDLDCMCEQITDNGWTGFDHMYYKETELVTWGAIFRAIVPGIIERAVCVLIHLALFIWTMYNFPVTLVIFITTGYVYPQIVVLVSFVIAFAVEYISQTIWRRT